MTGMLDGVRVVDLSTLWAAPGVAALLADYGAAVVKVEDTDAQDPLRTIVDERMTVPLWALAGRGKESVSLPLRAPEGQERLRALLERADIIILNQGDHVLGRWGLSLAGLVSQHPEAIVCALSAYGCADPRVGNGTTVEAAGGLMGGEAEPRVSGTFLGDHAATMSAAVAVLAALQARSAGGGGRLIEASMIDAALMACLPHVNREVPGVSPPVRAVLRTSDGRHVAVSATSEPQRARLWQAIQIEPPSTAADMEHAVASWARGLHHLQALARLEEHRIPAELVRTPREAIEHRRRERPDAVRVIHDPRFGVVMLPLPFGASADPRMSLGRPAGADAETVLAAWGAASVDERTR